MHGTHKTSNTWLKNYKIKKVFLNSRSFKQTSEYLRKQNHLNKSKVLFLLNNFKNRKYPLCNILLFKNKIVGFVGTIFSKKNSILNCNIHSWMVDPNHRLVSTLLFEHIKNNCVITVLSSLPRLGKVFEKMKYKKLIMIYRLIFFFKMQKNSRFEIIENINYLKKNLSLNHKIILSDYTNKRFKKFIIKDKNSKKNCFIICDILIKKKIFKTLNILYCSEPFFFKKNSTNFLSLIAKHFKVYFFGEFYLSQSNSLLSGRLISLTKNKIIYLKGFTKKYNFNLLYSETEF